MESAILATSGQEEEDDEGEEGQKRGQNEGIISTHYSSIAAVDRIRSVDKFTEVQGSILIRGHLLVV